MPGGFVEYRFRVHDGNAATLANFRAATGGAQFTVTSVRSDSAPYIVGSPNGDGASVDVFTGKVKAATYTVQIADAVTQTSPSVLRVFSSQLEDAGGLQQLGNRYAALDFRLNGGSWTTLTLGLLTRYTLSNNVTWDVTIDDPTKGENGHMAFAPQQDPATGQLETIAQYLARWPNRGCVFGGPVTGGFLNQPDRGGWEMTVNGRYGPAGVDNDVVQETFLDFHYGYAAPLFKRSTNAEVCMAAAKNKTDSLFRRNPQGSADGTLPAGFITTFPEAQSGGQWGDVIVEIIGVGYCAPRDGLFYRDYSGKDTIANGDDVHLLHDIRYRGVYVFTPPLNTGGMVADGTAVRVRAFTAQVSDISPIYWSGHPVDLLTKLWDEAGLGWDSTAVTNTKAAIGGQILLALRITQPEEMGSFLEKTIYGPFGIGVAVNGSGLLAPFAARRINATAPAATIDNTNVVRGSTKPFDLDVSTAIRKVTFEHDRLVLPTHPGDDSSIDSFLVQHERYEFVNNDAGAIGTQEITYTVPGMVGAVNPDNSIANDVYGYAMAIAQDVFSRSGRGLRQGATTIIRGVDAALDALNLGDEVLVNLKELPNHNARIGDNNTVPARAMQIVQRTVTASGYSIELADSGPNAQPYGTLPTVSIAASSDKPQNIAVLTITNAATLNAAPVGARVQMAVTSGATPASTDYTDVAFYTPGNIPTGGIRLPSVTAGAKVWIKARTESPSYRPSNYTAAASVTLTALSAPSGLTATPSVTDGSHCALAWTPGTTDRGYDTEIFLRASGADASTAIRIISLPSGSTTYTLEALTPGSAYTAGVQHRERATGIVSATTEVTFTASAAVVALPAPANPTGFSGSQDPRYGFPQQDGVYGMAVAATAFPGLMEFQEALETAVGSGSYGTPVSVAKVPNVQGDWTIYENIAPNDGLRRQLSARQIRDGATSSSYSATVVVQPWSAQYLPRYSEIVRQGDILRVTPSESSDGTTATLALIVGWAVDHVQAYYRTVPITTDPTQAADFSDTAVLPIDGTLAARAVSQACSFTFPQPQRNYKLVTRLVPFYLTTGGNLVAGESVVFPVTAAPPAINAQLTATKSGNQASLSVTVKAGVSDAPGSLQIIETVLGVDTTLLTVSSIGAGTTTLSPGSYPALADRTIAAGVESVSWRAVFTDVSGTSWTFGPVSALPALVNGSVSVTENPATKQATITASITDSGNYLNASAADPIDGTKIGALTAHLTLKGTTTAMAPTTVPGAGTSGNYTFVVNLDATRPTIVTVYRHYVDGSSDVLWSNALDSNKISDVVNAAAVNNNTTANVPVQFDNDTKVGAGCARYSLDGGSTWTTGTVASDYSVLFTGIARTASVQSMIIQGQNAIDGAWGNQTTVQIDAYLSEGPKFSVQLLANTPDSTHDRIVWSCTQGTALVSIDGAANTTPAASPIDVAKPATGRHTYVFSFTNGGVTVTDEVDVLPVSADTITPNLDVALGTPTATTQPVTVTAANPVSGGSAPTITVKCVGCTMTISGTTYPDGTTQTVASGTVVTGNRSSTTTATMAQLEVVGTLGAATERIVVPVPPQIQTTPTITATFKQLTSTTGQIIWSCASGSPLLSIDNGTAATPSASPIPITLDSNTHTYLFTSSGTGGPSAVAVSVPAVSSGGSNAVVISRLDLEIAAQTPTNTLTLNFAITGLYDHWHIWWQRDGVSGTWNSVANNTATWAVGPPTDINDPGGPNIHTFYAYVEAFDSGGHSLAASGYATLTIHTNADY